jgi:hypothetical protein
MVPDVRSLERGAVGGLGLRRAEADSASGGMHGQLHAVRRERDGEPHSACVRFPGSKTMYPAGVTITARRGCLDTPARALPDAARRVKGARARPTVCRKTTDGARSAPAAGSAASASARAVPGRPLAGTGRGTAVGRHTRHARPR